MTSSHDLHLQWQEAQRAYHRERDRYFMVEHLRIGNDEMPMIGEPVTPAVLARLAEMRAAAEKLRTQWYQSASARRREWHHVFPTAESR